jgi:hypothetical protein
LVVVKLKKILTWTLVVVFLIPSIFFMPVNVLAEPSIDINLTYGSSDGGIKLSWNKVDKVISYRINRDGQPISTIKITSYIDKNLPDSTYTYRIEGLDTNGNVITQSPMIDIKKTGSSVTTDTTPQLSCAEVLKGGKSFTKEQYEYCFFADNGTFPVSIVSAGGKYTITLAPHTLSNEQRRPQITFTFTEAKKVDASKRYFYFSATNPSYPNLSIRFIDCDSNGVSGINNAGSDDPSKWRIGSIDFNITDKASHKAFIDKMYKPGAYDAGCPADELDEKAVEAAGAKTTTEETADGATGGQCTKRCGTGKSWTGMDAAKIIVGGPTWGFLSFISGTARGALGDTLCNIQCFIIDQLTVIVASIIDKVLLPALGLSNESTTAPE